MSKVKITTFIPVYNMADTVERAILSVLNQDYENKELIVLDGGSTDGTVEVIQNYLDRIAYFASGPDGGSSKAIAANLVHATGEIVGMIGADDWYNPGALSAAAKTYEETCADVVYGDITAWESADKTRDVSCANIDLNKLYECCAIHTIASFVRKERLSDHYRYYFRKYDGALKITTDHYLWLRLYHAGRHFAHIVSETPITNFSLTGISYSRTYQTLMENQKVLEMVVGPKKPETEKYYRAIERHFSAYSLSFYQKIMDNKDLGEIIKDVTGRPKDYILFGAGDVGGRFSSLLQSCGYRVRYVADNYPERTSGFCGGVPVRSPEALLAEQDVVLLISTVNYDEMVFRQLQEMNLDPSVIVMTHDDFSWKIYKMLGKDILDDAWKKGIIQ